MIKQYNLQKRSSETTLIHKIISITEDNKVSISDSIQTHLINLTSEMLA